MPESDSGSPTEFNVDVEAKRPLPKRDATPEEKGRYVAAKYAIQDNHYRGLYQIWIKVLFFLVGKQWLKWNDVQAIYEPDTDVPKWRQQPVTNLTYAVFRTAIAKLTKNRPTLEVVPPSGDSEDREAAKLGEAMLVFLWRYLKHPQKVLRALGWFVCTGNVFLDADWDADAGKVKPRTALVEVENPDHDPSNPASSPTMDVGCPCDEEGEPLRRSPEYEGETAADGGDPYDLEADAHEEPEGEICIGVDDPFSTRFNPDCTDPDEATEWYTGKLWPIGKICEQFDVDEDEIQPSSLGSGEMRQEFDDVGSRVAAAAPDPFHNRWSNVVGADQAEAIGERAMVIYFYTKPDAKAGFPRGRHWIVAGSTKVWPPEKDADYPNGEAELPHGFWPPRVPLIDTPIPGQPQGIGMLTQVVPLNEALNHLDGKILEHEVTMTMGGVWFVCPEDRGITITSEPGQVKVSKAMGEGGREKAPFQAVLQPLDAHVYQERTVLLQKIQMVAGMSGVDMSQNPEGVTAGRAFLVLQEASDAAISTSLTALEEAIAELGRRELVIAREHYTEARTLKIRGDKGQWEFRSFMGADLRDGLDVRVQAGSMFPWSKSAQFDTKMSMIQALPQLVLKPDQTVDHEMLSKILDPAGSGLQEFESDQDDDAVEVEREHAMFEAYDPNAAAGPSNMLPQIGFWQNHPIHYNLHANFLKRSFARFQRWTPEAQQAFLDHVKLTLTTIQDAVNQIAPPVAPPGAAPGGPAAPPGDTAPPAGGPDAGGGPPSQLAPGPGGRPLALVPPGGGAGSRNTPAARKPQDKLQLTRGDYAAAGQ